MNIFQSVVKTIIPEKKRDSLRHIKNKYTKQLQKAISPQSLEINWIKKEDSWLLDNLKGPIVPIPKALMREKIEELAEQANQLGPKPLWEGYENLQNYPWDVKDTTPTANQVRTQAKVGNFYAHLVQKRKPSVVVEFGTAFGVSGMYWLSGLEGNNFGELLTFDPNEVWAEIARKNLSGISNRFQLVNGTFEDNIDAYLGSDRQIDMAFIDAIHTSEFVFSQFEIVVARLAPNGIILLDDIYFSEDMKYTWKTIALSDRVKASAAIERVGIVELKG